MSLPWFAFNIKDFVTNTLRLNTEAKGAYLMLCLDYYQTETPPPDDDEVLAAVTGLSLDAWRRHRRVIEPLFEVKDGLWHHARIAQELLEASKKHAASIARAEAGAAARWGKNAHSNAPSMPKAPPKQSPKDAKSKKPAPSMPQAMPQASSEQSLEDAHKQTQILDSGGDARAREAESLTDIEDALTGSQPVSFGTPIDMWKPDGTEFEDHPERVDFLNVFIEHHREEGTFSKDWPSLWRRYCDFRTAPPEPIKPKPKTRKAPPRVETDKRPEPIPGVRVLISPEAFALADEVAKVMGVEGMPVTVGMPSAIQTWLASWPAEIILLSIQKVMARRPGDPPGSMKYFENAIAREFAESKRPLPVATIAPSKEITIHGRQRTESKSVSQAARELAEEFAALTGSGTADGLVQGGEAGGAIPKIGSR